MAADLNRDPSEVSARIAELREQAQTLANKGIPLKGFLTGPGAVSMTAARAAEGEGRDPDPHVAARNARCVHRR